MPVKSLIHQLQQVELYPHPVERFELIETHISQVLLTGPYAYKLRKPVDFGFLDFTDLKKRFDDCIAELKLNRRFSPQLYTGLIKIQGSPEQLRIELQPIDAKFDPDALEYAVQMVEFPQDQLLSALEQQGILPETALETMATELAIMAPKRAEPAPH